MRRSWFAPWVAALGALAAACAPQAGPTPAAAPAASSGALGPPAVAEASLHIGAAQAGQLVQASVGQRFAIELVGTPTAGYVWAPAALPSFIARVGEATGPTTRAQLQPGFAGGNHWEVLVLVAERPGMGEVRLEQRRPWESNEPPNATFSVTIDAR